MVSEIIALLEQRQQMMHKLFTCLQHVYNTQKRSQPEKSIKTNTIVSQCI